MASSILLPAPPSKAVAALKSILRKPLFWVLASALCLGLAALYG